MNFKEGSKNLLFLVSAVVAGLSLVLSTVIFYGTRNVQAAAATCYWVGDTSPANWNDASHWSSSNGGSGSTCDGGVVPGEDDSVIFTSTNTNNVTIDSVARVENFTTNASYTGTITVAAGNSLTVDSTFTQHDGVFTTGDQNITTASYVMDGGYF